MPNLTRIKRDMSKLQPAVASRIDFGVDEPAERSNSYAPEQLRKLFAALDRMDETLTKEQRYAIMERQGCGKGGAKKLREAMRAFAEANAGKTLAEKAALLGSAYCRAEMTADGDIKVCWEFRDGDGRLSCGCGCFKDMAKRGLTPPGRVSRAYCGCCGGHIRYHYQTALGVGLRLKDVVSSPLDTDRAEGCGLLFEVLWPTA
ncbi:MAG: hypothetical protein LBS11_00360 [Oscillospiraceae bacterium]|jgi:hypothetical protein|nr:hypothetical protein [Oscillospiraceae bacterium]